MTRLFWLLVIGACAIASFIVGRIEDHAKKQLGDGEDEKDDGEEMAR